MSNEQEERVSELVDGEFDPRQLGSLLARIHQDDALRERWARYHLISDALHNNLTRGIQLDISQRVSAALEQEPVVFAPIWQRAIPTRRMVKQAAGVAMAASVTAVAIFGAQWLNQPAIPQGSVATVATTAPLAVQRGELVALEQSPGMSDDEKRLTQQEEQIWIRNLDSYVVNHNEYSGNAGMHGVLPYARLVSHDSQQ